MAAEGASCQNHDDRLCCICFRQYEDPRLLPCLHSLCRQCIDELSVSEEDGSIRCPLCRTRCELPANGAAGLPRDFTVIQRGAVSVRLSCGLCKDGSSSDAKFKCEKCQVVVCSEHALAHLNAPVDGGHVIDSLGAYHSKSLQRAEKSVLSSAAAPLCSEHNQPLRLFCVSCDISICGDCGSIGDHHSHKPIKYVKDIVDQRKTKASEQVDEIEMKTVARLKCSLAAVDKVCIELEERAEKVSADIEEAGKRAVSAVEEHVACLLQEVGDIKEGRLKILHQQRDELKTHLDLAQNVVQFSKRLMEQCEAIGRESEAIGRESAALFSLLQALQSRAGAIISKETIDQPQHHSRLMFQPGCDSTRSQKAKESLGCVVPFQASAKHTVVEGELSRFARKGDCVQFSVRVKGAGGDSLTTGGDIICPRWVENSDMAPPQFSVEDHGDGTYALSCSPGSVGTYQVEVDVNGERMANKLSIICKEFVAQWDPQECHTSITVREDKLLASRNSDSGRYVSVLGSFPMRHGQYTWTISVGDNPAEQMLGIASKPLSKNRWNDYAGAAQCWYNNLDGVFFCEGTQHSDVPISWSSNDTVELSLDCDHHTLRMSNLRTGEIRTVSNLPVKEYFPYAALHHRGQSVQFVIEG